MGPIGFGFLWNIKTTAMGVVAILSGLGLLGAALKGAVEGHLSMEAFGAAFASIATGVGLLFAKDGNRHGLPPVPVPPPQAPPRGFSSLGLIELLVLGSIVVLLSGCATLKGIDGSFGPIDLGNGVMCTVNKTPVVAGSTTVSAVCTSPIGPQQCSATIPVSQ